MLKVEVERNAISEFNFISATMICNWCDKAITRSGPSKNVVSICGEKGWRMRVSLNGKEWMVACNNNECLKGINSYNNIIYEYDKRNTLNRL